MQEKFVPNMNYIHKFLSGCTWAQLVNNKNYNHTYD